MMWGAIGCFNAARRKPRLPYDAELEWIETDGEASYINTGITSAVNFTIEIDCQLMSKHEGLNAYPNSTLFGARGYTGLTTGMRWAYFLSTENGANKMACRTPTTNPSTGLDNDYGRHFVKVTAAQFLIDNVSYIVTAPVTTSTSYLGHPMCIGRDGNINVPETHKLKVFANARFYSVKLYKNNVLVFDGIPVKVGTEGCMYDKVSNKLIHNSGGGTITPGPRV